MSSLFKDSSHFPSSTSPAPPTNDDIEAVIQLATSSRPTLDSRQGPLRDTRTQLFVGNLPYRVRWQDLKDLFRKAGTVLRADVSLGPDNRSRGYGTVLLASAEDAGRAIDMFNGYSWQTRVLEVRPDRLGATVGSSISIGTGMGGAAPTGSELEYELQLANGSIPSLASVVSSSGFGSGVSSNQYSTAVSSASFLSSPYGIALSSVGELDDYAFYERPGSSSGSVNGGRNLFVGNLPFHIQWQDLKDLFRTAGSVLRADVALGADGRSRGFGTVQFADEASAERGLRMFNGYEFNGRPLKVHYDKFSNSAQPLSVSGFPSPMPGGSSASQFVPSSIPLSASSISGSTTGSILSGSSAPLSSGNNSFLGAGSFSGPSSVPVSGTGSIAASPRPVYATPSSSLGISYGHSSHSFTPSQLHNTHSQSHSPFPNSAPSSAQPNVRVGSSASASQRSSMINSSLFPDVNITGHASGNQTNANLSNNTTGAAALSIDTNVAEPNSSALIANLLDHVSAERERESSLALYERDSALASYRHPSAASSRHPSFASSRHPSTSSSLQHSSASSRQPSSTSPFGIDQQPPFSREQQQSASSSSSPFLSHESSFDLLGQRPHGSRAGSGSLKQGQVPSPSLQAPLSSSGQGQLSSASPFGNVDYITSALGALGMREDAIGRRDENAGQGRRRESFNIHSSGSSFGRISSDTNGQGHGGRSRSFGANGQGAGPLFSRGFGMSHFGGSVSVGGSVLQSASQSVVPSANTSQTQSPQSPEARGMDHLAEQKKDAVSSYGNLSSPALVHMKERQASFGHNDSQTQSRQPSYGSQADDQKSSAAQPGRSQGSQFCVDSSQNQRHSSHSQRQQSQQSAQNQSQSQSQHNHPAHPGPISLPPPSTFSLPLYPQPLSPLGHGAMPSHVHVHGPMSPHAHATSPLYHPAHGMNVGYVPMSPLGHPTSPMHHPGYPPQGGYSVQGGSGHPMTPMHHPSYPMGVMTPHGLPPITPSMPPFTFLQPQSQMSQQQHQHMQQQQQHQQQQQQQQQARTAQQSSKETEKGTTEGQQQVNKGIERRGAREGSRPGMSLPLPTSPMHAFAAHPLSPYHPHPYAHPHSPYAHPHSPYAQPHSPFAHPHHSHPHVYTQFVQTPHGPGHMFSPGVTMTPGALWGRPGGPNPYINPTVGAPIHNDGYFGGGGTTNEGSGSGGGDDEGYFRSGSSGDGSGGTGQANVGYFPPVPPSDAPEMGYFPPMNVANEILREGSKVGKSVNKGAENGSGSTSGSGSAATTKTSETAASSAPPVDDDASAVGRSSTPAMWFTPSEGSEKDKGSARVDGDSHQHGLTRTTSVGGGSGSAGKRGSLVHRPESDPARHGGINGTKQEGKEEKQAKPIGLGIAVDGL